MKFLCLVFPGSVNLYLVCQGGLEYLSNSASFAGRKLALKSVGDRFGSHLRQQSFPVACISYSYPHIMYYPESLSPGCQKFAMLIVGC